MTALPLYPAAVIVDDQIRLRVCQGKRLVALEFTRSGPAAATITAIAQGETRFGTSRKAFARMLDNGFLSSVH
jgi:hypothetical protein